MWYFAWILGVLLACAFGIINAMWLESEDSSSGDDELGLRRRRSQRNDA